MNQPSSSRFTTNDCYICKRYKTFLLNNVSFIALVSVQVNFSHTVTTPYRLKTSTIGKKRNEGMNNEYRNV